MRTLALVLLLFSALALAVDPAQADELFTVVADSTVSGTDGFVLTIESSDGGGQSVFLAEEAGNIRVYAFRDFGSQIWDIQTPAQYLTPAQSMNTGDTWNYIESDEGDPMTAEVAAFVGVTVLAGTFDAYLVDITNENQPSEIAESIWFSQGVGFVRNVGYVFGGGGAIDWEDQLSSYNIVGGTGFMPLAVGNTWNFIDVTVPAESESVGELKSQYR